MSFVDKVPVKVFQGLEEKEWPDDEDGAGDSDDDFEVDEDTYQFYRGPAELYTADGGYTDLAGRNAIQEGPDPEQYNLTSTKKSQRKEYMDAVGAILKCDPRCGTNPYPVPEEFSPDTTDPWSWYIANKVSGLPRDFCSVWAGGTEQSSTDTQY